MKKRSAGGSKNTCLLQKELKEGLVKWLNDHGRPLLYKGKSYLETVLAYDEEKKRRRFRRAVAPPRRSLAVGAPSHDIDCVARRARWPLPL